VVRVLGVAAAGVLQRVPVAVVADVRVLVVARAPVDAVPAVPAVVVQAVADLRSNHGNFIKDYRCARSKHRKHRIKDSGRRTNVHCWPHHEQRGFVWRAKPVLLPLRGHV